MMVRLVDEDTRCLGKFAHQRFEISNASGGGTEVRITLPFRSALSAASSAP